MSVGEVCNREVIVVEQGADANEAARLMREFHVGDLVVVEQRGGMNVPVGIVTDRDLVVEILAQGVEAASVSVKDLMVQPLKTAREEEELLDALRYMRTKGLRRMPVVNSGGGLEGILTVDDILDILSEELMDVVALSAVQRQKERHRRP